MSPLPREHQDDVTLESLELAEGNCLENLFIDQVDDPMLEDHPSESSQQSIEPPNMISPQLTNLCAVLVFFRVHFQRERKS